MTRLASDTTYEVTVAAGLDEHRLDVGTRFQRGNRATFDIFTGADIEVEVICEDGRTLTMSRNTHDGLMVQEAD